MEQPESPKEWSSIQIITGIKPLKDYSLNLSLVAYNLADEVSFLFPRIGYLVCNLFVGESSSCRLLNYSSELFCHNHLYITGLLSEGSLHFALNGQGEGYAFKMHPVIGYHFLKTPMTQVTNRQVIVADALETSGKELHDLQNNERFNTIDNQYLERFLLRALPDKSVILDDPIYHAVNYIIKLKGKVDIGWLASVFSMKERTFRRQFLLKVGLPPQSYARIWKIQNALEVILENPNSCLEEVAFLSGYYDVAHLARDFKQRVNIAPSKLDEELNHPLLQSYMVVEVGT